MLKPMLLKAPLKDYLWGGNRLRNEYGKESALDKVAESWELSCHEDGLSLVDSGENKGKTLASLLEGPGKEMLGTKAAELDYFPLMIKLIDAKKDLSVQVHPDNEYAWRVEGEQGKTEMWYVVDAEPGASLIYGFKEKISKEEFQQRIEDNTLLEVCNQVPVHKGDVFFIEAGTLHAIGAGILICEVQQSSNLTYRVYDYGRLGTDGKPRQLHIDKALDVTRLELPPQVSQTLMDIDIFPHMDVKLLADCEYFKVYHGRLQGDSAMHTGTDSFHCLTVLEGAVKLSGGGEKLTLSKGATAFVPAGLGTYQLQGQAEFILSKL
ncbi:type I phosphomannose isomerase catalytic subunit [Selenomonas ruminantium]|uniref:Phosphohexomutase n=1 Tax=Selenomonas ruminantium TaxID=971 RepID=A0A1H0MJ26_SELRU|nr:type I phosphomannose isomerase catalytic subunit [Selenomonas ruminantium]SDO80150.1 mannose-6-phosphate isomerase, type 1 [Selenomonas ruminantium]